MDELLAEAHLFDFSVTQVTELFQQRLKIVFSPTTTLPGVGGSAK
jgi:hypothetical protein